MTSVRITCDGISTMSSYIIPFLPLLLVASWIWILKVSLSRRRTRKLSSTADRLLTEYCAQGYSHWHRKLVNENMPTMIRALYPIEENNRIEDNKYVTMDLIVEWEFEPSGNIRMTLRCELENRKQVPEFAAARAVMMPKPNQEMDFRQTPSW